MEQIKYYIEIIKEYGIVIISILQKPIYVFIWSFILYLISLRLVYKYLIFKYFDKIVEKLKLRKTLLNRFISRSGGLIKFFIILGGINLSYHLADIKLGKLEILMNIIYVIETILLFILIDKFIFFLKNNYVYKLKKQGEKEKLSLVNLGYVISKIIIIVSAILVSMKILGIDITPFLASAGLIGFAVAMASQEIIKNFISGIILFIEKPFTVGDVIKLPDGRNAVVEEIGLRMTQFKTYKGDIIFIPNNKLLETIENVRGHLTEKKKLELEIGLPYGVDIEKARQILLNILKQEDRLNQDTVEVFVSSLGDWSVNFKVRGDIPIEKYDRKINSQITEKIYNEINKAGIGFPFPTYEVLMEKTEENIKKSEEK